MNRTWPALSMVASGLLAGAAWNPAIAQSPATRPPNVGVFTLAQADRGERIYQMKCISCHAVDLSGAAWGPALKGDDFWTDWREQPVQLLFEKIRTNMPADAPGSLSDAQALELTAFVMKSNGFPPGETELPANPEGRAGMVLHKP